MLKGAGLPLQSMKLVLNEDLGALNEDASHVLDLNERLTRLRPTSIASWSVRIKSWASRGRLKRARWPRCESTTRRRRMAFGEERAQLVGQVRGGEDERGAKASSRSRSRAKRSMLKAEAPSPNATTRTAADDLRQVLMDNIEVPKRLTAASMAAQSQTEVIASHGEKAEKLLDADVANSDRTRVSLCVLARCRRRDWIRRLMRR